MRYLAILDGNEHEIEIEELAADSFSIRFGENRFEADLRRVGPVSFSVIIDNRSFDFDVARDGEETVVASRSGSTRLTVADAARRTARAAGKRREVSGRVDISDAGPGRQRAGCAGRRGQGGPGNHRGRSDEDGKRSQSAQGRQGR
jgi:hypothetical protein